MSKQALELENIKLTLTGVRKNDRKTIFEYLLTLDKDNDTELFNETLKYAISYLPNNIEDINDEFEKNDYVYARVFLLIGTNPELTIYKRLAILTYLTKYATKREALYRVNEEEMYFDPQNAFESYIIFKMINKKIRFPEDGFPFSEIFLNCGIVLYEYGDQPAALDMYMKANNWNPFSSRILQYILNVFKAARQSSELQRVGAWMLKISYDGSEIAFAMQTIGYGLYLDGKYKEAYAFYFESLKYDSTTSSGLNDQINAVLTALNVKEPYILTRKQLNDLFLGAVIAPFASETTMNYLRDIIIDSYNNDNVDQTIEYATKYMLLRPSDAKIAGMLHKSLNSLN